MSPDTKIAIVDDDESVRHALSGLLRSFGYPVESFGSGEAMLGANAHFDCVVSDVHMPGMNGFALSSALGARGDSPPVILISAMPDPDYDARARAAGALCMLQKPFTADALMDRLHEALAA